MSSLVACSLLITPPVRSHLLHLFIYQRQCNKPITALKVWILEMRFVFHSHCQLYSVVASTTLKLTATTTLEQVQTKDGVITNGSEYYMHFVFHLHWQQLLLLRLNWQWRRRYNKYIIYTTDCKYNNRLQLNSYAEVTKKRIKGEEWWIYINLPLDYTQSLITKFCETKIFMVHN